MLRRVVTTQGISLRSRTCHLPATLTLACRDYRQRGGASSSQSPGGLEPEDPSELSHRFHERTVVVENRFSTWCKRLWQLSSSSSLSSPSASSGLGGAEAEKALQTMQDVLTGDGSGRFPAMLVEGVWRTYDTIFPPRLMSDLETNVSQVEADHFFAFLHILTEVNYNVRAVQQLSERLAAELQALPKDPVTSAATSAGPSDDAKLERVTQICVDLQGASSPLYYVWMRESAALENGLRRLMEFRKAVHFFDVLCKRTIKQILRDRQATTTTGAPPALPLAQWQARHQDVKRVDRALTNLFHNFFRKEYLVMEELTWFSTAPALLEQIMAAESVQPFVNGLADMKHRLQPTHHRHLFAFLHPSVVEEPLIAVQVALTKGVARSVDHLLSHPTPLLDPANQSYAAMRFKAYEASFQQDGGQSALNERVDSAIFYSINSAQSALRGMDMGNMLIKRVVREVEERVNTARRTRGLETIRTFSTLSPIPGFVRWLASEVEAHERQAHASAATSGDPIFGTRLNTRGAECRQILVSAVQGFVARHDIANALKTHAGDAATAPLTELQSSVEQLLSVPASATSSSSSSSSDAAPSPSQTLAALRVLVALLQRPELFPTHHSDPARRTWWWDPVFTTALERPLLTSVAHYLYDVKKPDGRILDSVGNFHISNGATLYRLNFLGNAGAQGSRESGCVMVNYWYNLETISPNVLQYDGAHTVAVHTHITSLLEE